MAKQRRWKRWAAGTLVGLALLAPAALFILDAWANRRLERQVRAAESNGGSLSYADYLPALATGEPNASHALTSASHLLVSMPPDDEAAAWRDVPLDRAVADPALVDRARVWLERPQNRLALEIVDLWAPVREARYPHARPDDVALVFDRIASERGAPSLRIMAVLRTRALAGIADGRADDAYGDAALLLRLASWIRTEVPSVLTWIIGNAVAKTGIETMEELQQIAPPPSAARALLRTELTRLAERRRSWGLEADRAMSHQKMLRGGLWTASDGAATLWTALSRAFRLWQEKAFHARWLAAYGELIRQANLPAYERPGLDEILDDDSPFAIPVKLLVPNLVDSFDKTDAVVMRCRLALLALAWEEHREAEGAYPEDPQALVPDYLEALPADVFSGRPLVWPPEPDHRIVYSVGVNRKDDGGVDRGTPQSGDEDDIGWRLPG